MAHNIKDRSIDMSTPILELNGTHVGHNITIDDTQGSGVTASGILFDVQHVADKVSNRRFGGYPDELCVGRRACRINLGGNSDMNISEWATFTVDA